MIDYSQEDQYKVMHGALNERQWRLYVASQAKRLGRGGISRVAREAGVTRETIHKGMQELEAGEVYEPGGRIRRKGGGRKQATAIDETLLPDLQSLLQPKGDPMSLLKWTTKSVAHLKKALEGMGHEVAQTTIRRILHDLDYSLRANKKNIEGVSHADRDAQFAHITAKCQQFEQGGNPIISVDCKKKELMGQFKNNGAEWHGKGEHTQVSVYDFASLSDGKAIPYGVYDLLANAGFVNVGIDHDTAEFAVESIRRWWGQWGKGLYPGRKALLITADGGGSNGVRNRLWKKELQEFCNEEQLSISVVHYPPATSKWNKIEHRLFSYISINWRAKPLTCMEVVLELISHTKTNEGLTVVAQKDSHLYPTGTKVSDEEVSALHLLRDEFHGEWNYTILPQSSLSSGHLI